MVEKIKTKLLTLSPKDYLFVFGLLCSYANNYYQEQKRIKQLSEIKSNFDNITKNLKGQIQTIKEELLYYKINTNAQFDIFNSKVLNSSELMHYKLKNIELITTAIIGDVKSDSLNQQDGTALVLNDYLFWSAVGIGAVVVCYCGYYWLIKPYTADSPITTSLNPINDYYNEIIKKISSYINWFFPKSGNNGKPNDTNFSTNSSTSISTEIIPKGASNDISSLNNVYMPITAEQAKLLTEGSQNKISIILSDPSSAELASALSSNVVVGDNKHVVSDDILEHILNFASES